MNLREEIVKRLLQNVSNYNSRGLSAHTRELVYARFLTWMDVLDLMGFYSYHELDCNGNINMVMVGDETVYDINDKCQTFNP